MTTADYLESLQSDLSRTVEALGLQEGTNFTDIAQMAENGDIIYTGGEYTFVEYIRSTGTQYIELNYVPNNNSEFIIDFKDTNTTSWENYFGTDGTGLKFQRYNNQNNFFMNCGGTDANFSHDTTSRSTLIFNIAGVYDENRNLIVASTASSITTQKKMLVFLGYNGNALDVKSSYYLYNLIIKENDNMVLNLVPCYRKSDGVIGLYDVINANFYTNIGTGTFEKGPDV